jgi:hypothetical protein
MATPGRKERTGDSTSKTGGRSCKKSRVGNTKKRKGKPTRSVKLQTLFIERIAIDTISLKIVKSL